MEEAHTTGMTREQAEEEVLRYKKLYPVVSLLDERAILNDDHCLLCGDGCMCMRQVALEVLRSGGEKDHMLQMGDSCHHASARYLEVDGQPRVLLYASPITLAPNETPRTDLIYHDALSGVYNRRFYEDRLRHQVMNAGVALIDIDDFKLVNDTMGHHVGDLAITAVAGAMRSAIRSTDVLVRYGGDEFALVLPGIGQDDFAKKLEFVAQRIAKASVYGYPSLKLSASIGGVLSAGRTIEESLRQADKLMYRSKKRKKAVVTEADQLSSPDFELPRVLIVDDAEINREILRAMLEDEYEILEADCGEKALELIKELGGDLSIVLLDINMPGMNGFDVLSRMGREGWIEDVPVIMISAESGEDVVLNAYELGASDYISRPFDARVVRHRVTNIIHLFAKQRRLSSLLAQQFYERERESRMLVDIMAGVMELRNGESGLHVLHIRNLTAILLECLGRKTDRYDISAKDRQTISMASTLHDIGKMAIPDNILNKPGRLTDEEFEVMRSHAAVGAEMLENLHQYEDDPLMRTAAAICHWHHERWDGKGYPDGLKEDEIPIEAQVVSVADVYDALTSERVYKKAIPHEEAMRMILAGECGAFNPLLLECLVDSQDRILSEIGKELPPPSALIHVDEG